MGGRPTLPPSAATRGLRGGSRSYWFDKKKDDKPGSNNNIEYNGTPIPFEGYLTDRLGDWCAGFINQERDTPFFIFLSFTASSI